MNAAEFEELGGLKVLSLMDAVAATITMDIDPLSPVLLQSFWLQADPRKFSFHRSNHVFVTVTFVPLHGFSII